MPGIVETDCQTFLKMVLPADCFENQKQDMRTAFYAGCKSMMMMFRTVADEADEEVGCAVLDMVDKEIDAFYQEIKKRAAAERGLDAGS